MNAVCRSDAGPSVPPGWRIPLLAAGLLSMVLGVLAGLVLAGVPMPIVRPSHPGLHAALMFGGFFGTVIGLERAVAHARRWAYLAPAIAAIGAAAILTGAPVPLIATLQLGAGLVLTFASWRLHLRQPLLHSRILAIGAACWPVGTLVWLSGAPIPASIGFWSNFLVLTIAGERLELSRLMPPRPRARTVFGGLVVACLLSAAVGVASGAAGWVGLGASWLALAVWLVRHDIARRTARASGLTGFIGLALMAGYAWLAVGGGLFVAHGLTDLPLLRDAALHAVLLGFVMSMVLGHAPLIFPAVARVRIPYHAVFYVPLVLLHGALVLRVGADVAGWAEGRAFGAVGNALAIGAFVTVTAGSAIRGALGARRSRAV